jgi:hypothetical protein
MFFSFYQHSSLVPFVPVKPFMPVLVIVRLPQTVSLNLPSTFVVPGVAVNKTQFCMVSPLQAVALIS